MNRQERRSRAKKAASRTAAPDRAQLRAMLTDAKGEHQAGRLPAAERGYREILKWRPSHPETVSLCAMLLSQSGRDLGAIKLLKQGVAGNPAEPKLLNNLGNAYMSAGRAGEVAGAYRRALDADPDFAEAQFNFGNALRAAGDHEAAVTAYERAIEITGPSAPILINLAVTQSQTGRQEEALLTLDRVLAGDPGSFDAHYNRGLILQKTGRLEDANAAYEAAAKAAPERADPHIGRGIVLHQLGRPDDATTACRLAIARAPNSAEARTNLAAVLYEQEHFAEAEAELERAVAARPDFLKAWTNLGLCRQEAGDPEGALAAFREALGIDPDNKRAQAHFGIALQYGGLEEEASEVFDTDRLVSPREIARVEGWDSVADFNRALLDYIRGDPTLMLDRPTIATTNGSQSLEVLTGATPILVSLEKMIASQVRDYAKTVLGPSGNRFVRVIPASWRLTGWAVVLDSGGYQSPHIHPNGFCSGVYYVHLPPEVGERGDSEAGHIRFGQTKPWVEGPQSQAHFLTRTFAPAEGRMVLFPSHFWHHTIPFESVDKRVCIAFDALPN